jgi:hypothetical protein
MRFFGEREGAFEIRIGLLCEQPGEVVARARVPRITLHDRFESLPGSGRIACPEHELRGRMGGLHVVGVGLRRLVEEFDRVRDAPARTLRPRGRLWRGCSRRVD